MDPDAAVADSNVVTALREFALGAATKEVWEAPPAEAKAAPSGWAAELALVAGGTTTGADEEPAPVSREDVGLSFDDEAVVARLEDEGLKARIRQAHAEVAAAEQKGLPDLQGVRRADAEANRAMSQLVTALSELTRDLRAAADDVFLQASNARKLSQNQLPHGYPEGPVATYFEKLGVQTSKAGEQLEHLGTSLTNLLRDATLARRGYETVVADLFQLCDQSQSPPSYD